MPENNGMPDPSLPTEDFWEQHYGARERVWSGRVNVRLADVAADLTPGRALDLGCGEGADAIWLAEHRWQVIAVDVSTTALQRAADDARERAVLQHINFQRHDLSDSFPGGTFDLVSAQFLHSPVRLDRERILQRARDAVAPGGVLLIVDHGLTPPWAWNLGRDHQFPSADEVLESLRLDEALWRRVRADSVEREAVGPDGQVATVSDNVIVLRRSG
jgi:SAM-dependent methyltransferase